MAMKLFKFERIKEGHRFPYDVLISMGTHGEKEWKRYYIQLQSPFKSLDTYVDFISNREVTRWRRKTFRVVFYPRIDKMNEE